MLPPKTPIDRRRFVIAGLLAGTSGLALAQEWPTRPVRFIVPFPPGGGTDTFARPLAAKLSSQVGQQILLDNRAGAGGTVGADAAAKSPADGYTFLVGAVHHTVAVTAYRKLGYSLQKDLVPITGIAYVPDVLVVNNAVPAKAVQEFIAWCKANPGKVNFGSSGLGTTRHLAGEIFNARTGSSMLHIPYKGSGPAMTALLGGEIQAIFEGLGSAASHIRAGKIRALAVTSTGRAPAFPDIPTTAEAGLPGFESLSWYGLWSPAGTPPAAIARMQSAVARAFESQDLRDIWFQQGAEVGGESTERFAALVQSEIEKWGKAVRDTSLTMD